MMSTNLLSSWFCLKREALTACLVGETIPALLDRGKQALEGGTSSSLSSSVDSSNPNATTIQNPHAFALARLTVLCLVATLVGNHNYFGCSSLFLDWRAAWIMQHSMVAFTDTKISKDTQI